MTNLSISQNINPLSAEKDLVGPELLRILHTVPYRPCFSPSGWLPTIIYSRWGRIALPQFLSAACLGFGRFGDRQLVGTRLQHAGLGDQHVRSALRDAFGNHRTGAAIDDRHGVLHGTTTLLVVRTAETGDGRRIVQLRHLEGVVVMRRSGSDRDAELGDGAFHDLPTEAGIAEISQLGEILREARIGVRTDTSGHFISLVGWGSCYGLHLASHTRNIREQ